MENRLIYSAIASLSVVATGNVEAAENNSKDYMKLASIAPLVEVAGDVLVSLKTQTVTEQKEDEANSKGYEKGITCPPASDPTLCVTEHMDDSGEGYNYIKCTCYCNGQNTCMEMGYTKTSCATGEIVESRCMIDSKYVKCKCNPCSGYNYTNSCPSGWNSTGSCKSCGTTKHKCQITPQQRCKDAGYVYNKTCTSGHSTHQKPTNCSYDSSYKKCISMTTQEMCSTDGYSHTGNCTKYENKTNCPHSTSYNKCTAMSAGQKCVVDGYVSGKTCNGNHPTHQKTSNCPYTSTYKKCVSMSSGEMCSKDGYVNGKTCSGYYKPQSCSHNSAYKKCVAMSATEKCIKDGYASGRTCTSGHSTHQKRSSCPYYSSYYKCVAMTTQEKCNNDGYYKTSCQTGYALTNKCSHGNYYLSCNITPAQKCKDAGYTKSSCGAYYDVATCPYLSSLKRCDSTCESNLVAKGYKVNQNVANAIITKNTTVTGSTAVALKSVESYRSTSKCTSSLRPKPTLTLSGISNMKNRYYDGLNLKSASASTIYAGGTTVRNGNIDFTGDTLSISDGTFKHYSSSYSSRVSFKSLFVTSTYKTYSATFENVIMNIGDRYVASNGGGNVYFKHVDFTAKELFARTKSTASVTFSNNSVIKVGHTKLGYNDNAYRGARLRVNTGSKWYMSYGTVEMSDGAHFCVDDDDGSYIYFSGGYKKGGRGRSGYDGCRIYNDKTRTLSYTNWDPSSYTSWTIRSYCN